MPFHAVPRVHSAGAGRIRRKDAGSGHGWSRCLDGADHLSVPLSALLWYQGAQRVEGWWPSNACPVIFTHWYWQVRDAQSSSQLHFPEGKLFSGLAWRFQSGNAPVSSAVAGATWAWGPRGGQQPRRLQIGISGGKKNRSRDPRTYLEVLMFADCIFPTPLHQRPGWAMLQSSMGQQTAALASKLPKKWVCET